LVPNSNITPFPFARVFSEQISAQSQNGGSENARVEALEAECQSLRAEHEVALSLARAEAFQQGFDRAREDQETALLAAVDALQASIERLDQNLDSVESRLAREASELAMTAADMLAARALELNPGAAIDEAIGRALKQVRRGHPIRLRVHPDLVDEVERLVAERQASERRKLALTVLEDKNLLLGDASLQWDQGGLRLDAESRRAAVRAEVDGILPPN
jgi:flagellar assembly protein FliH